MDWTFTLTTSASGTVDGSHVFHDALVRIVLASCRLGTGIETGRHFAVFNGTGHLFVDERRFTFDPNRYGLLIECEQRPQGDWLAVAFGTVDSPLLTAGFNTPPWQGLPNIEQLQAEEGNCLDCPSGLEALTGDLLGLATLRLECGATKPLLTIQRARWGRDVNGEPDKRPGLSTRAAVPPAGHTKCFRGLSTRAKP